MKSAQTEQEPAQATLNGRPKVGGREIMAVEDDTVEDVIGWIIPFTIGSDFVVERAWLERRLGDLAISNNMMPSEVSSGQAFTRAGRRLNKKDVADVELEEELLTINLQKVKYERKFNLEVHDRREMEEFDGMVIGVIEYSEDTDNLDGRPKIDHEHEMWDAWVQYVQAFKREYDLMKTSHLGKDIRGMITRFFNKQTHSVRFRAGGGVYFAPAATEDVVQALDQLVKDIDHEWKVRGFPCELDIIEVADAEDKKSMVERKVRRELEREVATVVEEAIDSLNEEGELVETLVGEVEAALQDVEDFAGKYNALLDAEMSVREYLEAWKELQSDDAEQLVEEVIQRV